MLPSSVSSMAVKPGLNTAVVKSAAGAAMHAVLKPAVDDAAVQRRAIE